MTDTATATPAAEPAAPASNGATTWTEGFDETQSALVETKGWKGAGDLLSSYQQLETHVGRDPSSILTLPGEDATDSEWELLHGKLGRPAEADGYTTAEENEHDPGLKALAHKMGLNQRQFDVLRQSSNEAWQRQDADSQVDLKTKVTEARSALESKWGNAFAERDGLAGKALDFLGIDAKDAVRAGMMGGEGGVKLMEGLAKIGELLSEDKILGEGMNTGFQMTAESAQAEISALQQDQNFMNHYVSGDRLDPRHKDAVEKMTRLMKIAHPGIQYSTTG